MNLAPKISSLLRGETSSRVIFCPLCWVVAAAAIVGAGILLFGPSGAQPIPLQEWLRLYVFAGVITGAVLFARTGPAVFCEARRMMAQEPVALITAVLVVGAAPVLLLPFVVSAWPLVALWMVAAWLERREPLR